MVAFRNIFLTRSSGSGHSTIKTSMYIDHSTDMTAIASLGDIDIFVLLMNLFSISVRIIVYCDQANKFFIIPNLPLEYK